MALSIFAFATAILLVITLICCGSMYNLLDLWKFWLHNWMRLQLIAFLVLIGVYMPCCVQEFLNFIFRYTVRWNHAFYPVINNSNKDSTNYRTTMYETLLLGQFRKLDVSTFILHNVLVLLILQISILFIYIVLKIWDAIVSASASFFYKMFVLFEFTLLIFGYLIMHLQAFVYSFLNYKNARFNHVFFVFSFLFAIGYILVFVVFWLFSLFKLIGDMMVF